MLIIHDLTENYPNFPNDADIIGNNGSIKKCIGCFGCWVKTPGKCVINDEYKNMGAKLGATNEIIVISKCTFGSYSSFIKNVFDRSISYVLPYFEMRNGKMHHSIRYENKLKLKAYFYGENITEEEKKTAEALVKANALNFNGEVVEVAFAENAEKLKEVIKW